MLFAMVLDRVPLIVGGQDVCKKSVYAQTTVRANKVVGPSSAKRPDAVTFNWISVLVHTICKEDFERTLHFTKRMIKHGRYLTDLLSNLPWNMLSRNHPACLAT
jgi:hypothetical protein